MILLVSSNKDVASVNIRKEILSKYPFKQTGKNFQGNPIYDLRISNEEVAMVMLSEESVKAQSLPESFPSAKLIVFISRHSSQSGKPTLSVHAPGNLANAELGGLPRNVSIAPGLAMCEALKALQRYKTLFTLNYDVSYECTHHGPSLEVSTMFIELGSSETQWRDRLAAEAVGHAAMDSIKQFLSSSNGSAYLGIGGPHYNAKFTRMALSGEATFGHMIPKYAVCSVDSEILMQCVAKTLEEVSIALLDWKGIKSEDKPKLLAGLEEANIPFKKI